MQIKDVFSMLYAMSVAKQLRFQERIYFFNYNFAACEVFIWYSMLACSWFCVNVNLLAILWSELRNLGISYNGEKKLFK